MKKLMFVAATALCGLVFAEESDAKIQSANVVGYTTRDVVRGSYNMLAIQFQDVGAIVEAGDIAQAITTDLPALDYGTDYDLPDFPQIQIKTSDVSPDYGKIFYYFMDSEYDEDVVLPAGWYDDNEESPTEDDLIALGRGFWLVIPDDDTNYSKDKYTITFKGQVATSEKAISLPVVNGAYIIAANPFPAPLDVTKIVPSAGVPALDYGTDYDFPDFPQIQIKTSDISPDYGKIFYYFMDSEYDEGVVLPAGWYDFNEEVPTDTIGAGNSFWLVIPDDLLPDDKQTFTFSL